MVWRAPQNRCGEHMEPPCGSAVRTLPQQFLMHFHQQGGAMRPKVGSLPSGEKALLLWCRQYTTELLAASTYTQGPAC